VLITNHKNMTERHVNTESQKYDRRDVLIWIVKTWLKGMLIWNRKKHNWIGMLIRIAKTWSKGMLTWNHKSTAERHVNSDYKTHYRKDVLIWNVIKWWKANTLLSHNYVNALQICLLSQKYNVHSYFFLIICQVYNYVINMT